MQGLLGDEKQAENKVGKEVRHVENAIEPHSNTGDWLYGAKESELDREKRILEEKQRVVNRLQAAKVNEVLVNRRAEELSKQENMEKAMAKQDEMLNKEFAIELEDLEQDAGVRARAAQAVKEVSQFRHITRHEDVELLRKIEYVDIRKELDEAATRCSQMAMAGIYAAT